MSPPADLPFPLKHADTAGCRLHVREWPPYCPDRNGMTVVYRGNRFSTEQPDVLWHDPQPEHALPTLLRAHLPLTAGDRLEILDDAPYDLGVSVPLVKVRCNAVPGYVTLETLLGETVAEDGQLWVANDETGLRSVVEVDLPDGTLYSTIRLVRDKVDQARAYLAGIRSPGDDGSGRPVHPLQAGSEAHRLGLWALSEDRSAAERAAAVAVLEDFFIAYATPAAVAQASGWAWPYRFDFQMPWGTQLKPPWYSGYANSAMASAAACLHRLTGSMRYRELALAAIDFLRSPLERGGALYRVNDYPFVAEYIYRSPPIPNYRVCDGEMLSVVYLYDCAMLLADSSLLEFAVQLGIGVLVSLDSFCARDGLPAFGMDGQRMNPDYMWQLWLALQLLANIAKDRGYLNHARCWREAIPRSVISSGLPV